MLWFAGLANLQSDVKLASTHEWRAFREELAKHRAVKVVGYVTKFTNLSSFSQASSPSPGNFELTYTSSGDFNLILENTEYRWAKGKGIRMNWINGKGMRMDRTSKTWKPFSGIEFWPSSLRDLGLPPRADEISNQSWPTVWKETSSVVVSQATSKIRKSQIGYRMSEYGIDAGWSTIWWFDPKTHLVTYMERESLGPMQEESILRSMLEFSFDKDVKANFDLTPPQGYKRVK